MGLSPNCPDHSYQLHRELEKDSTQGILWGKKRDKQKEKNGIKTDVILGLPEKRKCPGFIRGSKSVPVLSGHKGSHASPSFPGQLGSCRSIHTTEGTTFDLDQDHSCVQSHGNSKMADGTRAATSTNQPERQKVLISASFFGGGVNSSCQLDRN